MSKSYDDTATRALIEAAAALHEAANALGLCSHMLPTEEPAPGSGRVDMRACVIVDPVQRAILLALDSIAAEIGEDAMMNA
jgi:hypothetical protein